ncbi:MAG TPA: M28 family peptidase [Nannocystaceae bacterium]|nr:M28 family peptidase [Nannocystaceae bacterium]
MFRVSRGLVLLALACGEATPPPQSAAKLEPDPATVAAPTIAGPTVESIRADVTALSADEMEGRKPGTEGAKKAVAYIVAQMQAIGLSPGGENGGWTQTVPMRSVATDPTRAQLELVGPSGLRKEATSLRFGDDWVGTTYRAAGTQRIDAELVFVGYGITAPEQKWDDYDGIDVTDKIVVVLVGDPPLKDDRFDGPALTYYGRWSYKLERALEAGALGCIIVHEDEPASYGWQVVRNSWSRENFHVVDPGAPLPAALAVQGWITKASADALAVRAGASLAIWHERAIDPAFAPSTLPVRLVGELVTVERTLSDVNVIGELPSPRNDDQAVLITAHWDHLGKDEHAAPGTDEIFNGAIDNASGIASMLAVARQLRVRSDGGRPLGRRIVFIATTGEEEGLLGSRWYALHPGLPLTNVAGVVNLDSTNVHGTTRTVQVIGRGQTTLERVLAEVVAAEGRSIVADEHPESGGYFRSDHFSFAQQGVPAIYLRGGSDMHDGGEAEGRRLGEVKAAHYHTIDDEIDPSWSFAGTLQDALTVASLVARVADEPEMPQWKPGSAFARGAR